MDPYLMRTTCFDLDFEKRFVSSSLEDSRNAACSLSTARRGMNGPQSGVGNRTDRLVDLIAILLRNALREGPIDFPNSKPLFGEGPNGSLVQPKEDNTGGGSPQSVQGPGLRVMSSHLHQQRVLVEPRAWHCWQTARFIDGKNIAILEQDFEMLWRLFFLPARAIPHDDLPRGNTTIQARGPLVDPDLSGQDSFGPLRAAGVRKRVRQIIDEQHPFLWPLDLVSIAVTVVASHNGLTVIEPMQVGNREHRNARIERNRKANMGEDSNDRTNHRANQPSEALNKPKRWLLPKRISFQHALRGVSVYLLEHTHARFHFAAALCVLATAFWLQIDTLRIALLLLAIGLVWVAEGLNTALEYLADAAVPQNDPLVRNAKDVAAGAVLLAAAIASLIGLCVLGPAFVHWISSASR